VLSEPARRYVESTLADPHLQEWIPRAEFEVTAEDGRSSTR